MESRSQEQKRRINHNIYSLTLCTVKILPRSEIRKALFLLSQASPREISFIFSFILMYFFPCFLLFLFFPVLLLYKLPYHHWRENLFQSHNWPTFFSVITKNNCNYVLSPWSFFLFFQIISSFFLNKNRDFYDDYYFGFWVLQQNGSKKGLCNVV